MSDTRKEITKNEQREEIKEYYSTRDTDIEVIPISITKKELLKQSEEKVRIVLYKRVSTDSLQQASSIALQEVAIDDILRVHPNWELVETYTDEGISGTSTKNRVGFNQMIADAEAGKFDLIVTRSVSRFARNLLDCVKTYRHLAELSHPVYVYFVSNNIITNGEQSEMILNFMAMLAEEESHVKSDVMNSSIEVRFGNGKFLVAACLGFDRVRETPWSRPYLVINKEEARTIREMYGLLLSGHTTQTIARILTEEGRLTKKGRPIWTANTVTAVLKNEKNYGALYARKTYTPNYRDHKSKKNRGERLRYKKENHHEGIISKEIFTFAMKILETRAKRRGVKVVTALSVINTGILRGFVRVERGWNGTDIDDYIEANRLAYPSTAMQQRTKQVQFGDVSNFNLAGFESVATVLFGARDRATILIDFNAVQFNKKAVTRLDETEYIEVFFNPKTFELAVRPVDKNSPSAIKWYSQYRSGATPYKIPIRNFTEMLYDYMQWNTDYKFKVYGESRNHGEEKVLFFSLRDIEILVPADDGDGTSPHKKYVSYYPESFVNQYGQDAYQTIYSTRAYLADYFRVWDAHVGSIAVKEDEIDAKVRRAAQELLGNSTEE